MTVTADDEVNGLVRRQLCCQLFILFKPYMCQQNGQIDITGLICVSYPAYLIRFIPDFYQLSDKLFLFGGCHNLLSQHSDKQYLYAIDSDNEMRIE